MSIETLIPLANAQSSWIEDKFDNKWVVRTPEGEELGRLPAKLTAQDVADIMRFARQYELAAFNVGISYGKGQQAMYGENAMIAAQAQKIQSLVHMNEALSEQLDQHISGETPATIN